MSETRALSTNKPGRFLLISPPLARNNCFIFCATSLNVNLMFLKFPELFLFRNYKENTGKTFVYKRYMIPRSRFP